MENDQLQPQPEGGNADDFQNEEGMDQQHEYADGQEEMQQEDNMDNNGDGQQF